MPSLNAASDFSFKPPIGKTFPLKVISPVIATLFLTGLLVNADKIAVVKDGSIVEEGSHESLMKLGGEYATLYNHTLVR